MSTISQIAIFNEQTKRNKHHCLSIKCGGNNAKANVHTIPVAVHNAYNRWSNGGHFPVPRVQSQHLLRSLAYDTVEIPAAVIDGVLAALTPEDWRTSFKSGVFGRYNDEYDPATLEKLLQIGEKFRNCLDQEEYILDRALEHLRKPKRKPKSDNVRLMHTLSFFETTCPVEALRIFSQCKPLCKSMNTNVLTQVCDQLNVLISEDAQSTNLGDVALALIDHKRRLDEARKKWWPLCNYETYLMRLLHHRERELWYVCAS